MRLLVVGDVHAPRTAALQRALALEGCPPAEVVSYAAFPQFRVAGDMRIRLDAPVRGEDDAAFLGYVPRRGEWIPRERWFRGFREALRAIPVPNADDVEVMCDKLACHERFTRASIPRAQLLGAVHSFDELQSVAGNAGVQRIFLKPVYGSSGAGIVAMVLTPDRVQAWTTVEPADGTFFNTRRIRVERDVRRLAALVDDLCARDRMFAERWIAKAGFDGRTFDLRIVVVAGQIVRIVVRASGTSITNLHLRNERHDVEAIRARIANDVWERAMDSALRATACFPHSLAAGIDLAFTSRLDDHRVLEINAFGDYVRTADDDGSAVYRRELQALHAGAFA
jgi:glutathione synthase/RimK-type ligase-like ATP-grasp enzyme